MGHDVLLYEVRTKNVITPDARTEHKIKEFLNLDIPKDSCLMVRCERLTADKKSIEYDTVGYFYGEYVEEKVVGNTVIYNPIKKMMRQTFYKYYKKENGDWVSISPDEYRNRVVRHEKREYEAFWGNTCKVVEKDE